MTKERMERRAVDEERVAYLRDMFPEVFTDGQVNVDRLRELLEGAGEHVSSGADHYELHWPGKEAARKQASRAPTSTLRVASGEGVCEDKTQNLLFVGDNLEILRLLQKSYGGRVNLIYIDPPYNTGNDFIYKDDFKDSVETYLEATRQADFDGILTTNPRSSGRFHSNWLSFMYPRLSLGRNLLSEDGLLVISIDDGEIHNLRLLLDQIFGEENFVANIVWQKAYVANMTAKFMSATHDHILVYAKNASEATVGRVPRSDEQIAKFENPDNDPRGPWKAENLSAGKFYAAGQFVIVTPNGRSVSPPPGRYWRCNEQRYREWLTDGRIWFGKDGNGRPMLKKFLSEVQEGLTAETWWRHEEAGTNKEATIELKQLFGGSQVFDTPKPVRLLKRIVSLFAGKDAIVLDFFAGSGTTGEAVLALNREDGGTRRFILVQLPESAAKSGHATIADITKARLKHVLEARGSSGKVNPELPLGALDEGFRVLTEDRSHVQRWIPHEGDAAALPLLFRTHDGLVPGWKPADLLIEVMLLEGYPLDASVGQSTDFLDNVVYVVEHPHIPARLLVCLDGEISDGTVDKLPDFEKDTFVCCESALNDTLKLRVANALHRVKTL